MADEEKGAQNKPDRPDGKQFKAGMAVGIGSAAIVAALLYARSGRKTKK